MPAFREARVICLAMGSQERQRQGARYTLPPAARLREPRRAGPRDRPALCQARQCADLACNVGCREAKCSPSMRRCSSRSSHWPKALRAARRPAAPRRSTCWRCAASSMSLPPSADDAALAARDKAMLASLEAGARRSGGHAPHGRRRAARRRPRPHSSTASRR